MRIALFIAVFIYGGFGMLDAWIIPDIKNTAWAFRYLVVCPFYAVLIFVTYAVKRERLIQLGISLGMIASGLAILAMMTMSAKSASHVYYAGIMLVLFYGYTFVRLRVAYSTLCAWLITLSYILVAQRFLNLDLPIMISSTFILVAANLIGMCAAYSLELSVRNKYLQTLDLTKANRELYKLSTMDMLTRVFNRRQFDKQLIKEWYRSQRLKYPLSLILLDLDFFKAYNDSLGHQRGDECLSKAAGILKSFAGRAGDFVARYGGEEFILILPGTPLEHAKRMSEKIRRAIENAEISHPRSGINRFVTISLGVATVIPSANKKPAELIAAADSALYRAKEKGRNRVET